MCVCNKVTPPQTHVSCQTGNMCGELILASRFYAALRFPNDVHQSEPFLPAFHHDTQDKANPAGVKLVLNIARLQLGEFLSQKTVSEFSERNRGRFMQAQYSCLVLSERCRSFLEVVIVNLWMR